jgi:hypothetical protein
VTCCPRCIRYIFTYYLSVSREGLRNLFPGVGATGDYESIVPESAVAAVDIRLPPNHSREAVETRVRAIVQSVVEARNGRVRSDDPTCRIEAQVVVTIDIPSYQIPSDHPLVQACVEAVEAVEGDCIHEGVGVVLVRSNNPLRRLCRSVLWACKIGQRLLNHPCQTVLYCGRQCLYTLRPPCGACSRGDTSVTRVWSGE